MTMLSKLKIVFLWVWLIRICGDFFFYKCVMQVQLSSAFISYECKIWMHVNLNKKFLVDLNFYARLF